MGLVSIDENYLTELQEREMALTRLGKTILINMKRQGWQKGRQCNAFTFTVECDTLQEFQDILEQEGGD
jgi:hypothetical protein